jgi:hypothetical protein
VETYPTPDVLRPRALSLSSQPPDVLSAEKSNDRSSLPKKKRKRALGVDSCCHPNKLFINWNGSKTHREARTEPFTRRKSEEHATDSPRYLLKNCAVFCWCERESGKGPQKQGNHTTLHKFSLKHANIFKYRVFKKKKQFFFIIFFSLANPMMTMMMTTTTFPFLSFLCLSFSFSCLSSAFLCLGSSCVFGPEKETVRASLVTSSCASSSSWEMPIWTFDALCRHATSSAICAAPFLLTLNETCDVPLTDEGAPSIVTFPDDVLSIWISRGALLSEISIFSLLFLANWNEPFFCRFHRA